MVYSISNRKNREMTFSSVAKTLSVPDAGREYYDLGRNSAYAAARRGDIPTIRIGKLLRVPVRALEQKLDATLTPDTETVKQENNNAKR